MSQRRVLVIGVGNTLMRDEGVGPRIAEAIRNRFILPDDVEVIDAGTMGLGMLHLFRGVEYMLVVDAIDGTGYAPGTVVRISPEDFAPNQVLHSLHDIRLIDVLNAASLIGAQPKLTECVGVQILDIAPEEFHVGLTRHVEQAVPRAVAAALTLLEEQGIEAHEAAAEDDGFLGTVRTAREEMRARREQERLGDR
ncbi:MAG: hydrogenase maturation protease [Actinobacteria bacterium]|nr:MAG: hydrogenase maturation protease [Actinomycetota bacterium]